MELTGKDVQRHFGSMFVCKQPNYGMTEEVHKSVFPTNMTNTCRAFSVLKKQIYFRRL